MRTCIVAVGNELLRGEVLDTNSHWLSQKLLEFGIETGRRLTTPDSREEIAWAITSALESGVELVILVGGLGPTVDDLTRDGIAQALDVALELDEERLEKLRAKFAHFGYNMPEQNQRQVEFPAGAEVLGNPWGTAPAFHVEAGGAKIVALPGVPREMKRIYEKLLLPRLRQWFPSPRPVFQFVTRTFGLGESMLESRVSDLLHRLPEQASWSSLPRDRGGCDLVITLPRDDEQAMEACRQIHRELLHVLKKVVYSTNPEEELDAVVHELLLRSNWSLAIAESCTGGLVASRLVAHRGCSKYLDRAIVTYSNRAKIEQLGVAEQTLEEHGAVSAEVALQMACGVRNRAQTDLGVGVTGIAGPEGGSEEKPVGLVYLAVVGPSIESVHRRVFPGDRHQIRNRAAEAMLAVLRRVLVDIH